MRVMYLECNMGAAGDMLCAALFELLPDEEKNGFIKWINSTGLKGTETVFEKVKRCGITGTHMKVLVDGKDESELFGHDCHHDEDLHAHHGHTSLDEMMELIASLDADESIKKDAAKVYRILADAESIVHGTDISQIHFHEVGTKDALIDILSVCFLMHAIAPDRVVVSPVCTGRGNVRCAHGILPVPAPATACILKDVPVYQGNIESELCTPTGAALIRYFADDFAYMPVMKTESVGYGMGTKEFERANALRAFLGRSDEGSTDKDLETVNVLSCNVDDMTGEEIGFALGRFLEAGACEAFTVPVNMKKSRPGIIIEVICKKEDTEGMKALIFRHTSTIGIRQYECRRSILDRHVIEKETEEGKIRIKESCGLGVRKTKYEFEDLARIAQKHDISLMEARALLEKKPGST
ncbi:MAG: nickel pincer cofactor biosynthesis protein LarC [Lachnospiraceae bacterium]|nr:nickel pincer cofactor biosynthesis protein LarC [Lachnospiraceae bacterium]